MADAVDFSPLIAILYQHLEFGGVKRFILRSEERLSNQGFNDRASSVEVLPGPYYDQWKAEHPGQEPVIWFCEDAGFRGGALQLTIGEYRSLHHPYDFGDRISSVYIGREPSNQAAVPTSLRPPIIQLVVELYRDVKFGGDYLVLPGTDSIQAHDFCSPRSLAECFGEEWNDAISSVRVTRTRQYREGSHVTLYRHRDWKGEPQLELSDGGCRDLRSAPQPFPNDALSSIQFTLR